MSKKLIIISSTIIAILILLALFLPLLSIKEIVFKDVGTSAPDKIYFQNYNPLAPRIYWIGEEIEGGDKTVVYAQLKRTGLRSFSGFNPLDIVTGQNYDQQNFQLVTVPNTTKDEILKLAKQKDLTKSTQYQVSVTPQKQIEDRQKDIDDYERLKAIEDKLPIECKMDEASMADRGKKYSIFMLSDFTMLNQNVTIENLPTSKVIDNNLENGVFDIDSNKIYRSQQKIADNIYPKIKIIELYLGDMIPNRLPEEGDKLNKIYLVLQDCTRVEVPVLPDGTFDFQAIESQIK